MAVKPTIVLGITLGDCGGVGPEVALKSAYGRQWPSQVKLVLVGSHRILRKEARRLRVPEPEIVSAGDQWCRRQVTCWQPAGTPEFMYQPGVVQAAASKAAVHWIKAAVNQCLGGRFHGMVTCPISKEGLQRAGITVLGHTELLARLTGAKKYAMMLTGGPLRVVLVTRHIPLSRVENTISTDSIVAAGELAVQGLSWLGIRNMKVGVCGLNPHAGDGGVIGRAELDKIAPAVCRLKRRGIDAEGPVPADVIFHRARRGDFGVVVAMYHDQGLAPLKMLAFDTGVNVTLGLPIVRTSPDHGTAFDIAGTGKANPSSMTEAIKLALKLAMKPNPWRRN